MIVEGIQQGIRSLQPDDPKRKVDPKAVPSQPITPEDPTNLGPGDPAQEGPPGTRVDNRPPRTRVVSDDSAPQTDRGYPLQKLIGRGGFGEVWLSHSLDGRQVAVKRIPLDQTVASEKERRGLELIRTCEHPNLIHIEDGWTDDNYQWIVMELADGTLLDRLPQKRDEGIALEELLTYTQQAAEALDYLHGRGILHRDIKPANLLLKAGQVKVADFGLVRVLDPSHAATQVGTPQYIAPEVLELREVVPASDQYSLAMTYTELRTGRHPFAGLNLPVIYNSILKGPGPNLSLVPIEAERKVLQRALSRKAKNRFTSCGEFVAALRAAVAPVEFDSEAEEFIRQARRRRVISGIVAAGCLLLLVLAWIMWPTPQTPASRFDWIPPGTEASSDAEVKTYLGHRVPSHVVVQRGGQTFHFLLIPADAANELHAFYMLRDKVSRDQFRAAWQTGEYKKALARLEELNPTLRGIDPTEANGEGSWPQYGANLLQAQAFAEWLRGKLPSDRQWRKAAGQLERPLHARGPFKKPATADGIPEPGAIAIGRESPRPINESGTDESIYQCRDMSGNGHEWTRTDKETGEDIDVDNLKRGLGVRIRGQGYRAPTPYLFDDRNCNQQIESPNAQTPFLAFRVILPIPFSQ